MNRVIRAGRVAGLLGACVMASAAAGADDLASLQNQWWQWALAIPASHNPIYDKTGNRCGLAQRGEYWFLAGNTGGAVTRSCTVPKGVKLLVPLVNNVCFPDAALPDGQCIADTDAFIESYDPANLTLRLDGNDQPFEDVRDVVAQGATLFTAVVGANGTFGLKPGLYRANVARGYWGVVDTAGLDAGPHVLELGARGGFSLSVIYKLNVTQATN